MSRVLLAFVCAYDLLAAQPASAHQFWLEPSTYRPAIGQEIGVGVSLGDVFYQGLRTHRSDEDIIKFVAHGPSGQTPVAGNAGDSPIGKIAFSKAGIYILEFVDRAHFVEIADAPLFEKYLVGEGLDQASALRKQRGQTGKPGREIYSHFLKTIVVAGDPNREIRDRALGLKLEVVCESRLDAHRNDDPLSFKVLYQGAPLKGVMVAAYQRKKPTISDRLLARTDATGHVAFKLKDPDVWNVDAVHMIEAPQDLKATLRLGGPPQAAGWQSFWASLTFELLPTQ